MSDSLYPSVAIIAGAALIAFLTGLSWSSGFLSGLSIGLILVERTLTELKKP